MGMDTKSVAYIRRANGVLFFDSTKALISWDPLTSAVDPSTKCPQDQPMETTASVEDESTPAEGSVCLGRAVRQSLDRVCLGRGGRSRTKQDVPAASDKQSDRRTRLPNGGPFFLVLRALETSAS
ncbi:hypothetical protein JTB14_034047 [Gonioctena quinquepunctata]|nr:hypothetical protein JTB14_034047 [Gonioctena quinquepunctata]